ncbi:MAG: hypothetical protein KA383_19730 [Phycisphaerae bacterium]|nr:hypothetical protein [Phycisphaerae bacterium]
MLRSHTMLLAVTCLLGGLFQVTQAAPPPAPDALTEFSAAQWGAAANGASSAVYNDTARRMTGSASLRYETTGCFDTWLWAPVTQNAGWDLLAAGSGGLKFWVHTTNPNGAFQGPCPWIHVCTTPDDYYAFHPSQDFLNAALGQWVQVTVPFNGDATWSVTTVGAPSLSNVNYIEIHGDTWGCNFTAWFDGLRFDVPFAPPEALIAVAGHQRVDLNWLPFNDFLGEFDHYAVYRDTQAFTNVTGRTPLATIAGLNNTSYADTTAVNGVHYHYAVTAVMSGGGETTQVESIGPRTPRNETDLQVTHISRTPRYPRYWPEYTYYWVTEPNGFGPYVFSAATSLGGGQSATTQRWPIADDPVTYTAHVRNRGTVTWTGTLSATWRLDGVAVSTPAVPVTLAPGAVTTFAYVLPWDGQWHEICFTLNVSDSHADNNSRSIWTKSAPFLTYVDLSVIEDFRERSTPNYPQAATEDMLDWLQRHMDRMNQMFADAGSVKRVHYDLLEVLSDHDPDPGVQTIYFGVFPFRYYGHPYGDPRSPGYYHADVDIDYGLCHELSHQLGLIDIYQLDLSADQNLVSNMGYSAVPCLMNGCSPFYSTHSALGMNAWADIVHGYYGQYMYHMPEQIKLRILDYYGQPLAGATVKMYQLAERPEGKVIANQIKAQGVTDASGEWTLPNVPINPSMVPPTFAGEQLHDNPFGYLAVVGTNGLLHFKIEYDEFVDYAWLDITEVNVAYFQGQTQSATFERQVSIGGGIQHYPPADMAELNAANWSSWAQDGTITLSDDAVRKKVGAASLLGEYTGGYDNYVRYPAGILAKWDLSSVQSIRFWAYSENPNFSYQSQSPWVRLGSYQDGYFQWTPSWDILNTAEDQWREFVVPIAGNSTWTRTTNGTPSLAQINYLEIHADTWGAGFDLWLDGVCVYPQPYRVGDLNCDGVVNFGDINAFVLYLSNHPVWLTTYAGCDPRSGDIDGDGNYPSFGDINPFVTLLTGGGL